MSVRPPLSPPGGTPPPATATLMDGTAVDLQALAEKITDAHLERHPEDRERYGEELARAWCTHDNQHLLAWAVADILPAQLAWLAGVLTARNYPLANLLDNVDTGAEAVRRQWPGAAGQEVSERMRAAARTLGQDSD